MWNTDIHIKYAENCHHLSATILFEHAAKSCLHREICWKVRKKNQQITRIEIHLIGWSARMKATSTYLCVTVCFWVCCHVISSEPVIPTATEETETSKKALESSTGCHFFSFRAPPRCISPPKFPCLTNLMPSSFLFQTPLPLSFFPNRYTIYHSTSGASQ